MGFADRSLYVDDLKYAEFSGRLQRDLLSDEVYLNASTKEGMAKKLGWRRWLRHGRLAPDGAPLVYNP